MSRARHKAEGGKVEPELKPKPYNAEGSEVEKEADEKARGGRAKKKRGGMVEGEEKRERLDRSKRKTGGRVGSDKSPFTSAKSVRDAEDHKSDEGSADEGP